MLRRSTNNVLLGAAHNPDAEGYGVCFEPALLRVIFLSGISPLPYLFPAQSAVPVLLTTTARNSTILLEEGVLPPVSRSACYLSIRDKITLKSPRIAATRFMTAVVLSALLPFSFSLAH